MGTRKKSNADLKRAMKSSNRNGKSQLRVSKNKNNRNQENTEPSYEYEIKEYIIFDLRSTNSSNGRFNRAPGSGRETSNRDQQEPGPSSARNVWNPTPCYAGYAQDSPLYNMKKDFSEPSDWNLDFDDWRDFEFSDGMNTNNSNQKIPWFYPTNRNNSVQENSGFSDPMNRNNGIRESPGLAGPTHINNNVKRKPWFYGPMKRNNNIQENPRHSHARAQDVSHFNTHEVVQSQNTFNKKTATSAEDVYNFDLENRKEGGNQGQPKPGPSSARDVRTPSQSYTYLTYESSFFHVSLLDQPLYRNLVAEISKKLSKSFWTTTLRLKKLVDSVGTDENECDSLFHMMDVNIIIAAVVNENLEIYRKEHENSQRKKIENSQDKENMMKELARKLDAASDFLVILNLLKELKRPNVAFQEPLKNLTKLFNDFIESNRPEKTSENQPTTVFDDFMAQMKMSWTCYPPAAMLTERDNPAVWSWYQNQHFRESPCLYM